MKRFLFLLLLLLSFRAESFAQTSKVNIMLTVEDLVAKRQIGNATVCVFSKQDNETDTLTVIKIIKAVPEYLYCGEFSRKISLHDTLFVRTHCENYEEETTPFVINKETGKNKTIELSGTIRLRRAPKRLKEVTVTASKIMMVNKGDTIVYNADYFQLAEGSMLDELISRLPGVKLESGGRITVNGNFVSSLLINGKDFFKGDATVALENLPAYMVSKVKAYQRTPDNAYITRNNLKAKASDPWVIDVNLKRQYSQGWMANAEAGYGTHDRYFAKLFGLRFADFSRFSLFANFNNLNDDSRPGREGTWESFAPVVGLSERKKAGFFYSVESKNRKTTFSSDFVATHEDDDVRTEKSSETFLTNGNSYLRSRNREKAKNTYLNWVVSLSHAAKRVYCNWDNVFFYNKSRTASDFLSAESSVPPIESRRGALLDSLFVLRNYAGVGSLTNYYQDLSRQSTRNWTYTSLLSTDIRLPRSRYINLQVTGRYSHTDADGFSQYALFTPRASGRENFQNKYQTTPRQEYQWWANAHAPVMKKKTWKIDADYTYRQEYYSDGRKLYRLDSLGGEWATAGGRPLGMLPSTGDSLTRSIDCANTFQNGRYLYRHTPELQVSFDFKKGGMLSILLPVSFEHNVLNDLRMRNNRSRVSKHYVGFEPQILYQSNGLSLEARKQLKAPTMTYLLNVRDDSNPLVIYKGNPSLKATDVYLLSTKYSKTITKQAQNYYAGVRYQIYHNAVGQSRLYDTATGVTTYIPRNMNGNWTLNVNGGYARSLDQKQRWSLSADAAWNHDNSVDFLQTGQNTDVSARSVVRNNALDGNFALRHRQKFGTFSFTTSSKWQHATSGSKGFSTINSLDMLYGVTANLTLPWGMAFNTDCTLHTRGGYSDETMNMHEWIWNAEVTKSILKKKSLILKVRGYDLLHQRHNIVRTLNAQGRTETWYNTVPDYILFTLLYRLNIQPKKHL